MSGPSDQQVKDQAPVNSETVGVELEEVQSMDHDQGEETKNVENEMPTAQQEEEMMKKKYGGLLPKKKPLISKDHEHAFFDSADWALGKQGSHKPKGPLEALRPKLQPTPHHQARSRRSAYAPSDDEGAHPDSSEENGNGKTEEEDVTNDETSHS